jgi:hypothetical protein
MIVLERQARFQPLARHPQLAEQTPALRLRRPDGPLPKRVERTPDSAD